MNRVLTRLAVAGAATATVLALTPTAANAGATGPFTVTGQAVCDTAGPVGRYQLNWTVTNVSQAPFTIDSATESGAFTGTVTLTPNPVPALGSATGSDGPVPGTTTGVVTLNVNYTQGQIQGNRTGTITLDGTCVIPSTTSSVAPTTTAQSSTTTTTKATTTTVQAATATPKFTG